MVDIYATNPGPIDGSVLYDQDKHVSAAVWDGQVQFVHLKSLFCFISPSLNTFSLVNFLHSVKCLSQLFFFFSC